MRGRWKKWLMSGAWMIAATAVALEAAEAQEVPEWPGNSPWDVHLAGGMSITSHDDGEGGIVTIRVTTYADGVGLLQLIGPEGEKRKLFLGNGDVMFFHGWSEDDWKTSKMFIPYGFFLQSAMRPAVENYPQGYATVPGEWETSNGIFSETDNSSWKMQARRVERNGRATVEMRVTIFPPLEKMSTEDDSDPRSETEVFSASWTRQREPALPDSFDLTGWQGQPEQYAGVRTLGELRRMMAAQREMPAKPEAVQAE